MQNKLIGELIGLARATDGNEHLITSYVTDVIIDSLCTVLPLPQYTSYDVEQLLKRVEEAKRSMIPDCFLCASPCGKNSAYDMTRFENADVEVRSLKTTLLNGICCMAIYARQAAACSYRNVHAEHFFFKALIAIGMDDFGVEDLISIVLEMGDFIHQYRLYLKKYF